VLEQPELSPRELATRFTDTNSYDVSESSVYRRLKAHDLITSPERARIHEDELSAHRARQDVNHKSALEKSHDLAPRRPWA
jgi:hypothetical protein